VGLFPILLISGAYLDNLYNLANSNMPEILKNSIYVIVLIGFIGLAQLYGGVLNFDIKKGDNHKIGQNDQTIDRFGWKELGKEFKKLRDMDVALGNISQHAYIIAENYSSASHYEYYLANPNNIFVKTIGIVNDARKYSFITQELGGFKIGESAYYIESSRDKTSGNILGHKYFNKVEIAKTIYIRRLNKPVVRYIIYRLKDLNTIPPNDLISVPNLFK
jgi:hypothetical protein